MELTWIVVLASLCSLASPSAASGGWDESSSRLDDFSDISPDDNEPAADLSHMSDDEFLAGGAAEDAVRRPGELPASSASSDKSALMLRVLGAALKRPGMTQRFGQVLPILRVMSPPQRLALTALIMQQVMVPKDVPDSPLEMAMRLGATPDGRSNLTSELLLPLSADIAHIFRGAGLEAPEGASRPGAQGRSAGGVPGHQFRPPHPLPPAQMPPPRRRATLAGVSPALPPPLRPASGLPPPLRPAPVAVATPDDGPQAQWPQRRYGELPPPGVNRRNANAHVPPSTDMVPPPPPGRSSSTTLRPYGPAAPLSQADRHDCSLFSDTVCASVEHYPEEAILASIQADKHTVDALLADKLPPVARSVPLEMQRRQDDDYPGENPQALDASDGADDSLLCPSIVKYARPQRARATSGQWKYIVNTAEHTQTLRLEKCSRVEEPCQYLSDKVRSHCAQVYNYHRLLTWDREQGLHMDIFKVPTCCSCQVLKSPFLTSNSVARRPNLGGLGGSQFLQHQKQQSLSQPVAEYTHTKETVVGSETGRPVLSPYKHFSQQQVDDSRRDPQPASPSKPTWPFRKPATRRPPPQLSRGQPGPPQYGLQTLEDTAAPADLLPQYPPLPLQHERDYPPLRRAASVRNRTRVSQPAKDDPDVPDDLEAEGSQPVAQRRPLPVILTPAGGAVRGPTSPLLTATSKRPLSPALPPRLHRPSSSAPTSATPPTPPAAVPSSTPTTKRVNYSYHPIIDFFRPLEKQMAAQEPRRARPAAVALDEVESRTADDDAPPPGPAWSAQQSDWSPITKRSEAT